jgi:hypothetical protein
MHQEFNAALFEGGTGQFNQGVLPPSADQMSRKRQVFQESHQTAIICSCQFFACSGRTGRAKPTSFPQQIMAYPTLFLCPIDAQNLEPSALLRLRPARICGPVVSFFCEKRLHTSVQFKRNKLNSSSWFVGRLTRITGLLAYLS